MFDLTQHARGNHRKFLGKRMMVRFGIRNIALAALLGMDLIEGETR